ncbi:putative ribonuclease H-like domain-containing protein, partial [Tanacetum coccineum]
ELLQGKTTKGSSTNSFNTVSTPVNAASAPRSSNDAGPSFDTAEVQNTGIFGSAFDDVDLDTYNSPLADQVMVQRLISTTWNLQLFWVEAMQEELLQFKIQKVWSIVDLPYGKKAIGTKTEAIRLFLAYASFMNFVMYQMDVKSAFLYGTIKEEVYVSQPPGFVDPEFTEKVYKVEIALYGLHQAPRAWYETLSTYLLNNGFYRGQIDKTLFIKRVKGDILLVQVYVDDIIFGSTKKSLCINFEQIMHKRFQVSSLGELTFFLGLQVKQKEDEIFISQDKYVGEILKKFGFSSIRTTSTPMETNKALTKDEDGEDVDVHLYKSMIGSLMYLTSSRTDIMFSVCACSRFQVQPKVFHLNAVKRIFRMRALEGEGSTTPPEPQPTPSTTKPVFHEPQTKAHIKKLLPYPTTYQRKRKTQKCRRTKKDTQLPQTSVPQDLRADEAVYKEGAGVQLVKGISLLFASA